MIETLQGHGVSLNRRWVLCELFIKEKNIVFNTEKKCLHNEAIKSRNRGRKRRHRSLPFYTYTIEVGLLKVEVEKWTASLTKVIKKRLHQYVGNYRFKIFFFFS